MRTPVTRQARPPSRTRTFPAPVRGWIENENLAGNRGLGASVMENWFPLTATVRLRRGAFKSATIGAPVDGMFSYEASGISKLFAASASNLFDITLMDGATVPNPVWTQIGNGRFSTVQISTGGGEYLLAVNGSAPMLAYDGQEWQAIVEAETLDLPYSGASAPFVAGRNVTGASSGAYARIVAVIPSTATTGVLKIARMFRDFRANEDITGSGVAGGAAICAAEASAASSVSVTGVDTRNLSHIWVHNSRVWAVERGTMKAWYLPVDQIGGAAVSFNLGAVFQRGGSLLFGATWSADSGSGFADRCVFVSDQGEIAVYEGIDPADAGSWSKTGQYAIGRPIGVQTMRAGGDLLIATDMGLVPMSQVASKDAAALSAAAVSAPIEPAWQRAVRSNSLDRSVQVLKWEREHMGIVGWPHRGAKEVHVVNLTTGAWAKWTGLDVQAMAVHGGRAYFGDVAGNIFLFEGSGSDDGAPYIARFSALPDDFRAPASIKVALMARATFRALSPFTARLSVATDYRTGFPTAPNAAPDGAPLALWDSAQWDVAKWDDGPNSEARETRTTQWVSIGRTGFAIAPQVQVTCGSSTRLPDAELASFDVLYSTGGAVV